MRLDGRSMTADPVAYRRRIGYVPEEPHLYTHLTAIEYLTLVGRLRGMPEPSVAKKVPALLHLLLLWDSRYDTMAVYSKGMRQRVLLAAALMHNPDLLVLDEPFSGLDVTAGLLFRTLLRLFAAGGRMVLFSTHRFDIVEQLCSRVVILSRGRIVAEHESRRCCSRARRHSRRCSSGPPARTTSRRWPARSSTSCSCDDHGACRLRGVSPSPRWRLSAHFFRAMFDFGILSGRGRFAQAHVARRRRRFRGLRLADGGIYADKYPVLWVRRLPSRTGVRCSATTCSSSACRCCWSRS